MWARECHHSLKSVSQVRAMSSFHPHVRGVSGQESSACWVSLKVLRATSAPSSCARVFVETRNLVSWLKPQRTEISDGRNSALNFSQYFSNVVLSVDAGFPGIAVGSPGRPIQSLLDWWDAVARKRRRQRRVCTHSPACQPV